MDEALRVPNHLHRLSRASLAAERVEDRVLGAHVRLDIGAHWDWKRRPGSGSRMVRFAQKLPGQPRKSSGIRTPWHNDDEEWLEAVKAEGGEKGGLFDPKA